MSQDFSLALAALQNRAQAERWIERIRAKDATLWSDDVLAQGEVKARLGWLDSPEWLEARLGDAARAMAALRARCDDAVVLGMGGSSLSIEVLSRQLGYPRLRILDSTDPDAVRRLEGEIDVTRTLFFVSSKSGSTVEVEAFYRHFAARARPDRFVCITDPGTPLAARFPDAWLNPPDIGGRFSVLSYFGMLPLAWAGESAPAIVAGGRSMLEACRAETPAANPGLALGLFLGAAADAGRDKLTWVSADADAPFAAWMEQLVAESTGKGGRGLLPVTDEVFDETRDYGGDRAFVFVGRPVPAAFARQYPCFAISPANLGGEFARWQFATAVAGIALGLNPFDQPDVNQSKERTRRVLAAPGAASAIVDRLRGVSTPASGIRPFLADLAPGSFLGLLLYAEATPELRARARSWMDRVSRGRGIACTLGYGPRFLHSTGQFHKGGPNRGRFLQVTCGNDPLPIPGWDFGFGDLKLAQALGDFEALRAAGRAVMNVHVDRPGDILTLFE